MASRQKRIPKDKLLIGVVSALGGAFLSDDALRIFQSILLLLQ